MPNVSFGVFHWPGAAQSRIALTVHYRYSDQSVRENLVKVKYTSIETIILLKI